MRTTELRQGATYLGEGRCVFQVWAPWAEKVDLSLLAPAPRTVTLERTGNGTHRVVLEDVGPETLYLYRLDGEKERPDPASRYQPDGVHGPSQVIDPSFAWEDAGWNGLRLQAYIIYELHVGTFTAEGTFDGVIAHLPELKDLGITAIEIMPVAQFPGSRNWGYDGVYPFAVQNSYGGPDGLKRLVNACHRAGLAVVLDVVYNHLGAEGNYLGDYGPYFTDRYQTAWGAAVNFDGPDSDDVRRYFLQNALYWLHDFHIDALRLDAIHAMLDFSAGTFLEALAAQVEIERDRLGRQVYLIAESDLNNPRIVQVPELGGYGLDAQWSDDLHHALHVLLTGESNGYYQDYSASGGPAADTPRSALACLAKALRTGYVYTGQYSRFRRRSHGLLPRGIPAYRFVVSAQNHDQVGNRMLGERLAALVDFDKLKIAAGIVLLSPFIPLLFMGEEYAEPAPFQYFVSHSDPTLIEAVRRGRRSEFAAFAWQDEPPDPQDEETFRRSALHLELREHAAHRVLYRFYQELIGLRKTQPALQLLSKDHMEVFALASRRVLCFWRWVARDAAWVVCNFSDASVTAALPAPRGHWHKVLDSRDRQWQSAGDAGEAGCCDELPAGLDSEGELDLTIPARSLAVFVKRDNDR